MLNFDPVKFNVDTKNVAIFEPRKNPSNLPLYWLFNRDLSYNGLFIIIPT